MLFAALLGSGRADSGLASAHRARALLGTDIWSQVIRIENGRPYRPYPPVVHALVFELEGALWFYTASDGTQSLSHYVGRTAADKANLGPLLRDIDAGFATWVPEAEGAAPAAVPLQLANGCFIESVALLRARLAQGLTAEAPRLLSYYVDTAAGRRGHTVLEFATAEGLRILDPDRPTHPIRLRAGAAADPRTLAFSLRSDIAQARWLPLTDFCRRAVLSAASRSHPRIIVS